MRRIVLLAVFALALAPQSHARTWLKTVAAAEKAAKEKKQLILVDMFADWCGWCHRFEREVFPSAAFQKATDDMVLLRLDTEDGAEGTQYARKFGVTSLPTFLVLTPELELAGQIRGYAPPAQFVQMLAHTREKHVNFTELVKNESKIAKDYTKRLELANEFGARNEYAKAEVRFRNLAYEKGVPPAIRDEAFYQLALAQVIQNKPDEAHKTIKQLTSISKSGNWVERARFLAGELYAQQGKIQNAIDEFRSFKKAFPTSVLIANIDRMLPHLERRLASNR